MNINYTVGIYPALLQDMVVKIYEVDINGATSEVGSHTIPERDGAGVPTPGAGHQVPWIDTFSGLDSVTHEIRLYTASATFLDKYTHQANKQTITLLGPIRFKIGDGGTYTPTAGSVNYLNPVMAGLLATDYIAFRTGYGPMIDGVHITNNIAGGFDLLQPDDVFSGDPPEEWTIMMVPSAIETPVNDSVVGKQWGPTDAIADMYLDVNSAVSYIPGHLRKLIRLAGSGAIYTFSSSDVPPIGYIFRFTNFGNYTPGGSDPEVHFDNAPLLWGNTTKTVLAIPIYCTAEFVWDGTAWNCSMITNISDSAAISFRYRGTANIGNVVYENIVSITIPDQGSNNYLVVGALRQNTNNYLPAASWSVRDQTATSFKVAVDEWTTNLQDLKFDFGIVR